MTPKKKALGRGLDALLSKPRTNPAYSSSPPSAGSEPAADPAPEPELPGKPAELSLKDISPNPRQPRRTFDAEALEQLADSIREHGVLQPVLVTKDDSSGHFTLLAGERRLRASELAGRETIPVRVIEADDAERLEIAVIENVQREDLDPVEEALAYQQLAISFGHTQDQIAKRVGKSRVAISNALRLLKLDDVILQQLKSGEISAGHARALLMLESKEQQALLAKEIAGRNLTVRQAETEAKELLTGKSKPSRTPKKSASGAEENLDVVDLQERITLHLGCPVRIRSLSASAGRIEIKYSNLDDLDRVLELMGVKDDL